MKKKSQIIYGRHPILDALDQGISIETIYVQNKASGETILAIKSKARQFGVPFRTVPRIKLDKITNANHQGVVALTALVNYQDPEHLIPHYFDQGIVPLMVAVENITDVRNIGAIARSAECLGAKALVLPFHGSAQINEHAIKSSAGAILKIDLCRVPSLEDTLIMFKNYGIQIVATSLDAEKQPDQIDFSAPTCLVMGSEDEGISNRISALADHLVKIPQAGATDSLNVSVAAGILLYEAMRQRMLKTD
jgi:23S rRNA (guanosine2251-2'-O)-methyltransferase